MRILTTSLCYPTPAHPDQGVFVQRRAAALAEIPGVAVQVISPQPWCPVLRKTHRIESAQQPIPVFYPNMLSVPPLNRATDGIAYAHALQQYIESQRQWRPCPFDLIDAHFVYPDGVGAWLAGRKLGIPVTVTVRGKIVSLSKRTVRRMQIGAMLRGVDSIIAVSHSLVDWVHRVAGCELPVDVIPNGLDAGTFHWVDRDRARDMVGWDRHTRYVLAVGHLQHVKGFDRIVESWPAVRTMLGDVRLVLIGSRRGERTFQKHLSRLIDDCNRRADIGGGEPCVQYLGTRGPSDLNLLYNACDLTVVASRSEGWNNSIGESFATGTPVVATDVGGNAEQVCSTELGLVVRESGSDALAGAIVHALSQPWNRPLIAAHGTARSWSMAAREVLQVFRRVLASHRQPAESSNETPRLVLHRGREVAEARS